MRNPSADHLASRKKLLHNQEVRQFIKFCIVGASSTVVTFAVDNIGYKVLHMHLVVAISLAFVLGVINGFYWNRRWTFKQARGSSAHEQSLKFLAVNLVGYVLNTSIIVLIVAHFSADTRGFFGNKTQLQTALFHILAGDSKESYSAVLINGAQLVAVAIVVWWNYFANKLWTFKK